MAFTSRLKELSDFVRREHPSYVSGDDDFATLEGTREALKMVIDRIADDEQELVRQFNDYR